MLSSAKVLRILLWTSEIALALVVVYAIAYRTPTKPAANPTPAPVASPQR